MPRVRYLFHFSSWITLCRCVEVWHKTRTPCIPFSSDSVVISFRFDMAISTDSISNRTQFALIRCGIQNRFARPSDSIPIQFVVTLNAEPVGNLIEFIGIRSRFQFWLTRSWCSIASVYSQRTVVQFALSQNYCLNFFNSREWELRALATRWVNRLFYRILSRSSQVPS